MRRFDPGPRLQTPLNHLALRAEHRRRSAPGLLQPTAGGLAKSGRSPYSEIREQLTLGFNFIKVTLLLAPLILFIPALKISAQVRVALIALVVVESFWLASLQAAPIFGEISNAATVALNVTLFLTLNRD